MYYPQIMAGSTGNSKNVPKKTTSLGRIMCEFPGGDGFCPERRDVIMYQSRGAKPRGTDTYLHPAAKDKSRLHQGTRIPW